LISFLIAGTKRRQGKPRASSSAPSSALASALASGHASVPAAAPVATTTATGVTTSRQRCDKTPKIHLKSKCQLYQQAVNADNELKRERFDRVETRTFGANFMLQPVFVSGREGNL
jgi:hypothetical protein